MQKATLPAQHSQSFANGWGRAIKITLGEK
jgi:hypothetical protein